MKKNAFSLLDVIPSTLATLFCLLQIILGIYLLPGISQIQLIAYLGVGLYVFSGLIFGMLPVFEFRRNGGVTKGKSYIYTTRLVDTGIYSIVRHPQFITFILWAIAGMLLFQHWVVILLGIPVIPFTYIDLLRADNRLLEKFGDEYRQYMERVPKANFIFGVIKHLRLENR